MEATDTRHFAHHVAGRASLTMRWMERFRQDLTFAVRSFARTPGFTIVVIVTLALGIGATSAIFSIVNSVFLNPLPYRNPDRLVVIWERLVRDPKSPPVFDSYADFQTWKNYSRSFERLAPATWANAGQTLTGMGPAREILAMPVGVEYFSLLGVPPRIGRTFQSEDLNRGCTVVLKHSFWLSAFGGRESAIGRHINLNEKPCTVIGVMPPGFTFYPNAISAWMLITPDSAIARDPVNSALGVFGLLKRSVSIAQAQQEVELLYSREPGRNPGGVERTPVVYPLAEQFAYLTGPNLRLTVMILFASVTFVLLIACVNIANLLRGRSLAREKELAVRAALGSGRLRLIQQLLTEGLLLSFAGAAFGILLARAAVAYFQLRNPIEMPPGNPVSVNLPVLAFTAALAVLTALLFGLVPALKASRTDLVEGLRASGRSASFSPGARAIGNALVAGEVMLSLALLAGAGLLIESVNRLASVPLGFRTDRLLAMEISLPKANYVTPAQRSRFYNEALDKAAALPGVESTAVASSVPLSNGTWGGASIAVEGKPEPDAATARLDTASLSVTPGYFRAMGVPVEAGRAFDGRDRAGAEAVVVVNQALARRYFPHESPISRHIKVGDVGTSRPWLTIIGVVADEKDRTFFHEMTWEEVPTAFRPVAQDPPTSGSLLLRTASDNLAIGADIQKQIAAIDSNVPVGEVQSMDQRLSRVLAFPRFRAAVLGTFAALALLLAGVGLYGVLAQLIAQRTREFGVRMALGAQKRDVLTLVIRQGLTVTVAGLIAGVVVALSLTRFLGTLLYGVRPTDPWTLALVSLVLLLTALLATWLPARRAAKTDPMVALRYE
jgi:predicted permease